MVSPSAYWPYFLIADHKELVIFSLFHRIPPCKRPKRRQQADPRTDLKARQAQTLPAFAAQAIHRMHMPRQDMMAGMGMRFMLQGERAHQQRLRDNLNPQVDRRVTRALIVIAANQRHRQVRDKRSPGSQRAQRATGVRPWAVQEIAEKDHLRAR